MKKNIIKISFISLFVGMIFLPLFQNETHAIKYAPLNENRNRIQRPTGNIFARIYREGPDMSKEYEKFINDNYGMRDFFIKLKNQIDYSLYGISDDVVIGSRGNLEYRSVIDNEEIKAERFGDKEWNSIQSRILVLNESLKKRGITLILLPIEQKNSIYPEDFSKTHVFRPKETAFTRLTAFLKSHKEIQTIDSHEILMNAKKNHTVYYKTDFHWNEIGAFFVAKELVDRLGVLSERNVRWTNQLETRDNPGFSGGINLSLATFYPPIEPESVLVKNWKTTGSFIVPTKPYGVHYISNSADRTILLPETMLVGNSFLNYFKDIGFYEKFSEIYFLHLSNFGQLSSLIPDGTKFVIIQFIEVDIGNGVFL
jgi:hypothetical protein